MEGSPEINTNQDLKFCVFNRRLVIDLFKEVSILLNIFFHHPHYKGGNELQVCWKTLIYNNASYVY